MTKQTSSSPPLAALHATKSSCCSSSTSTSMISCFHLKGHLDSVLCLDYDNDTNHLLSGSEDKTARLWDLRTSATTASSNNCINNKPLRASLCIQCPGAVNSVVFGPLHDRESTAVSASSSASSSSSLFGRDCSVFLAVDNSVYGYDLRYATSPVIQWNDTSKLSSLSSTDEINQVVFSQQKRKQSTHQPSPPPQNQQQHQQQALLFLLAAADDAGEIRVTNHYWINQQQTTVLKETGEPDATPHPTILQHSAPGAMIMACAFRPNHPTGSHHHHPHAKRNKKHNKKKQQHRQQPQDELLSQQQSQSPVCTELLATGGTDCAVQLWDVSSNPQQQQHQQHPQQSQQHQQHQPPIQRRRPLEQHTMQPVQSGASQVCNPPMVHSLDWSPSGRILAAGLGDGSVSLFTVPNHKSLVQVARLEDAHGGAVASVHFPCTPTAVAAASSPDRLLLTAGNDGVVVAWDLGATLCEPDQQQQQDHNNHHHHHHHNKDSHHHGDKHEKPTDDVDDDDALSHWVSLLQLGESENNKKSNKNDNNDDDNKNKDKGGDDYDFDCDQPKTLFGIQHGIKPNWMITNYNRNPCTIFVADTSNDITAYTIPS